MRGADAWWVFAIGNQVVLRRSADLKCWTDAGSAIRPLPAWHKEVVPRQKGHRWAPAIIRHGGFYQHFVNWGICCRGLNSAYGIRTGRCRKITGPYLDKQGRDLAGAPSLASKTLRWDADGWPLLR